MRVSHRAGGMTSSDSSESRHDSATIATAVATAVVRFDAIEVAVEVTTPCMPLTSLVRRDCTSPPRVRVKKPSDWRCRCANTEVRSSCITRCPTWVDSQVCTTPSSWVTTATATIAPTVSRSRRESCCGRATSTISRTRKGCASATTLVTTMIADDDRDATAVRAEERGHPGQGHRGVGELGAVAGVDAHRATASAPAAATAVG